MFQRKWWLISFTAIFGILFTSITAEAQWVMVARAAKGRVQRMQQKPDNAPGYDIATLVLEAAADKVYQTALKSLQSHADLVITRQDPEKRIIQFSKGQQVASLRATLLGDKLTQLVIASSLTDAQPSTTSLVVQAALKVCTDMHVNCVVEEN